VDCSPPAFSFAHLPMNFYQGIEYYSCPGRNLSYVTALTPAG
jgi:hypothetical protein